MAYSFKRLNKISTNCIIFLRIVCTLMPTFTRSTRVNSPMSRVWKFHSKISGLEMLTPSWFHLKIESITDASGKPSAENLSKGTTIVTSINPFKIGSPIIWNVKISDMGNTSSGSFFRDIVTGKPFEKWVHTHSFKPEANHTIMTDSVEYLFEGFLRPFSILFIPFFWIIFTLRHHQVKKLMRPGCLNG